MIRKLTVLFLMITSTCFSQIECTNGMAGEYPCKGYDLMAHIPVSILANTNGIQRASDIWGWTDTTNGKEYAIVAMTNSTAFVDISDPIKPVFLGRLDTNAGVNIWRDVKVYNNHAFIVADNVGAHGMQVFDLTRLRGITAPQTFTADAIYNTDDLGSCHNIVINEDKGVAYLVGCSNSLKQIIFNGGPIFVDISDPKNPTKINHYAEEGYSHDAQVITYNGPDSEHIGKEIYVGSNATKISILDVTNKNNVVKLADLNYSQLAYTHQGWFTENHRYFILGDELDEKRFGMNTRTLVFDFQDLDNPVISSIYFGTSTAIDHNGYVKGNEYFMANYRAGIRIFNISNIGASSEAMVETGYFDTYPLDNKTSFNGVWSVYPYFSSGNIIISDKEEGLFIVRKSGTLSSDNFLLKKGISIFPNPTTVETQIRSSEKNPLEKIAIYNILGQRVFYKDTINKSTYVLSTNTLKKGVYIIKINATLTRKLIVR